MEVLVPTVRLASEAGLTCGAAVPGSKRRFENWGFRRQSGTPRVRTDRPKADIDYRSSTLLVAEWNAALAVAHDSQLYGSLIRLLVGPLSHMFVGL